MRMLASAIAAALLGTASLAYAATDTGRIRAINQTKHSITLDTGSRFTFPHRADLSIFKVGEKVTVGYHGGDGKKMAYSIHSQAGPAFTVGGALYRVNP